MNTTEKGFGANKNLTKDLNTVHEVCMKIRKLSTHHRKLMAYQEMKDLAHVNNLIESTNKEIELDQLKMEALMGITNITVRKNIIKNIYKEKIDNEKTLYNILEQHKDNFLEFIMKRRITQKVESQNIFSSGYSMITRFGDMLSESMLNKIKRFNKTQQTILCFDGIKSEYLETDDLQIYFQPRVYLDNTRCKYLSLNSDRNQIEINENERDNILQLIEEHAKSLEDFEINEEYDNATKFNNYLEHKRKSITCDEIVKKFDEKFKKTEHYIKENYDPIEENDDEIEDEEYASQDKMKNYQEGEDIDKEKNEKRKKIKTKDKSYIHYLEHKLKKKPAVTKKKDIEVLDLEHLQKDNENKDTENDSNKSSESELNINESQKKESTFFFPWKAIYATEGPWKVRLLSRPIELDILNKVYNDLKSMQANGKEFMCNNIMAQVLDLAHPSHQLQNLLLTYPLSAATILKKRLLALGYKLVIPIIHEEINTFTVDTTIYIMSQIIRKVEREMKFYFEVNATNNVLWRIGYYIHDMAKHRNQDYYPGMDEYSFGFDNEGYIYWNNIKKNYEPELNKTDKSGKIEYKIWGFLIDIYKGTISMEYNTKDKKIAFGYGSTFFSEDDQKIQGDYIKSGHCIPVIALNISKINDIYYENPSINVNFGSEPFSNNVSASSINDVQNSVIVTNNKKFDNTFILRPNFLDSEKNLPEEEKKLFEDYEKNSFNDSLVNSQQKSFSQFPPNAYCRVFACIKIQRAWRRYIGKRMRNEIRRRYNNAAIVIQRMYRNKMERQSKIKDNAALIIQRNWRKTLYIKAKLFQCIYNKPIADLNRAAQIIQTKYKCWTLYHNSEIAQMFNRKIEDINNAVEVISTWWKAKYEAILEQRKLQKKIESAIVIQKYWKGYHLRKLIKPALLTELKELGNTMIKKRQALIVLSSVYKIQKAWKDYQARKIRAIKIDTRNKAATKIQALWKGYQTRILFHLHCSYGESVFLNAVYSGLAECHYILKLYKPCGIVCPYHPKIHGEENENESSEEYYDDDDDDYDNYEEVNYKL
ncbi:hypothetical protein BCR36DRAFT_351617 [Piromyces finnis]|uniref:SPRY domain-containing protein n=1 Tax=Piromyces finnis TaxID=1754191 RepID=A0A1Y1VAJ6_9FUNG|nr:hypothetical protein BCR36DRAFT_351617 [Piromyces finnis]|eukprot:ORX51090.1 hypothetical protein BCR36DRAFT_351617 [Piromyces finnis]